MSEIKEFEIKLANILEKSLFKYGDLSVYFFLCGDEVKNYIGDLILFSHFSILKRDEKILSSRPLHSRKTENAAHKKEIFDFATKALHNTITKFAIVAAEKTENFFNIVNIYLLNEHMEYIYHFNMCYNDNSDFIQFKHDKYYTAHNLGGHKKFAKWYIDATNKLFGIITKFSDMTDAQKIIFKMYLDDNVGNIF